MFTSTKAHVHCVPDRFIIVTFTVPRVTICPKDKALECMISSVQVQMHCFECTGCSVQVQMHYVYKCQGAHTLCPQLPFYCNIHCTRGLPLTVYVPVFHGSILSEPINSKGRQQIERNISLTEGLNDFRLYST